MSDITLRECLIADVFLRDIKRLEFQVKFLCEALEVYDGRPEHDAEWWKNWSLEEYKKDKGEENGS